MANKVRIALVGCGGISGAHMHGYRDLAEKGILDFEFVATCDVNRNAAETRANEAAQLQDGRKPTVYEDVNELLANEPDVEAVDICALHRVHHDLAVAALNAGKHVIIEKPLGVTMKACALILEAARRNNRILAVAENYRRSAGQRATNWALNKGVIGAPRILVYIDYGEHLGPWGWRDSKVDAGAGWVLDGGVHYTDMFLYHLGEAKEVYAHVRSFDPHRYRKPDTKQDPIPVNVEDSALAIVTVESGAVVQWSSVRAAPGQRFNKHLIYGEEGSLDYGGNFTARGKDEAINLQDEFQKSLSADQRERFFPAGITNTIAQELWEFGKSLRDDSFTPETDGVVGMKAMAICMGVFESAWINAPVDLREVEACRINGYQADIDRELGILDANWNVWA
ncbi:MAG: Gfo/Idh/MocA family oxidoreductase [Candidatus Poribacteria bacterium]|nr:Gfo/Idh/MocA family oxidoreductase [Candidatus Poribacteria bacterium]